MRFFRLRAFLRRFKFKNTSIAVANDAAAEIVAADKKLTDHENQVGVQGIALRGLAARRASVISKYGTLYDDATRFNASL